MKEFLEELKAAITINIKFLHWEVRPTKKSCKTETVLT